MLRAPRQRSARSMVSLARRRSNDVGQDFRPRSLELAAAQLPDARWALISVPGRYAAGVARQALDLGKHVFLYSDNVSLEDEVALKHTARERGLLVMGPDCGTAIVHGIGLGFANRVRREPISGAKAIGIVAASGTGLQAVASRVHALGGAISHALGTGGRDLKAEVGATTASQVLDLLARDPETGVIVLISKPPAPAVAIGCSLRRWPAANPWSSTSLASRRPRARWVICASRRRLTMPLSWRKASRRTRTKPRRLPGVVATCAGSSAAAHWRTRPCLCCSHCCIRSTATPRSAPISTWRIRSRARVTRSWIWAATSSRLGVCTR